MRRLKAKESFSRWRYRFGCQAIAIACLGTFAVSFSAPANAESAAIRPVEASKLFSNIAIDPTFSQDKSRLHQAVDFSLSYLNTPSAQTAYQSYPLSEVTLERVRRSLLRFQTLLAQSSTAAELQLLVQQEFEFYQAAGKDGEGTVEFTGYFTPTYPASRISTEQYRYPLFKYPENLSASPHPTRLELEGADGLQWQHSMLAGQELVWLRDRLEAFLIQVQGSARLDMTDGSTVSVGYAGSTDYPYTSIGKQLVADGVFTLEELTLPKVLAYFADNPSHLDRYIPRNQRFVFFEETAGAPPRGSLGVPVVAGRSIATDKSLMPPGALAVLRSPLPQRQADGSMQVLPASRYVLDHDTGSAIRGPGRVDIFTGVGDEAKAIAGEINHSGQLYYLLLKDEYLR